MSLPEQRNTHRLIDGTLTQMLDHAGGDESLRWQQLLNSLHITAHKGSRAYSITRTLTSMRWPIHCILHRIGTRNAQQVRR
jgi:hypothetical protein